MLEVLKLLISCVDTIGSQFEGVELCKIQPRQVILPSEKASLITDLHLRIEGAFGKCCVEKCCQWSISTFPFTAVCKARNNVYLVELR